MAHINNKYKVIATVVITPLDDRTRYAQSVVADLQPLGLLRAPKSFRSSDPDTMTTTALEATASSSGKNSNK